VRKLGELILANVNKVKKGASAAQLVDPYTQKQIEVKLDPHLTPQGNAQRYFVKYKKAKRGQPRLREQIRALTEELKALKSKFPVRRLTGKKITGAVLPKEPFLKFDLDSGSVVFAGKSARSNDELTFKHARPGDYFFHTRGFEGAHIILRPNIPRGQRPSKEEIRIAAAIAAHFSKAKKQKNVAVSYTQRKYLKKSKKGKVGSVILMREEVIFVDPELPT
jgi:predicted ribosome quality control (RQC) complex YloA/Tae2 family protein